jgi:hypothetical protein
MNLPLVLDLTIGLVFIYLILSLLASEIQELVSTLLQWRAVHLKKSIENLLTGAESTVEDRRVKEIVDDLYNNPLIQNINQTEKKGIEAGLRKVIWLMYRIFQRKHSPVFGKDKQTDREQRSAPSYIPSETFATTLIERLNITQLTQKISFISLIKFKDEEIKSEIKTVLVNLVVSDNTKQRLKEEYTKFNRKLERISNNFRLQKTSLSNSINRIENEIKTYIENSTLHFSQDEEDIKNVFDREINSLKEELFLDRDALEKRLKAGLAEVIYELESGGQLYKNLKNKLQDNTSELYRAYEELEKDIEESIGKLPEPVRASLTALGRRAQVNAKRVDQELKQFQHEIEVWFDRSMDRASGVYKRNAKGVGFLIGLILAFVTNTDTFHVVNRLSKDTALRTAITQNASSAVTNCPTSQLDCIRTQVNQSIGSLPIGRSADNLLQQEEESKGWQFPYLKRILGWIVSGIAISMGAPFWFELLGKVMNVRNTGPKPSSSTEERNSSGER